MKPAPYLLAASLFLVASCSSTSPADLAPFRSDGCTAFPDGNDGNRSLWLDCCLDHDIAYWLGGSYSDRLRADEALRVCMENHPAPLPASVLSNAVRLTGSPYFPTPFRWGYGWPFPRGYRNLDPDERAQAALLLTEAGYTLPTWLLSPKDH